MIVRGSGDKILKEVHLFVDHSFQFVARGKPRGPAGVGKFGPPGDPALKNLDALENISPTLPQLGHGLLIYADLTVEICLEISHIFRGFVLG